MIRLLHLSNTMLSSTPPPAWDMPGDPSSLTSCLRHSVRQERHRAKGGGCREADGCHARHPNAHAPIRISPCAQGCSEPMIYVALSTFDDIIHPTLTG